MPYSRKPAKPATPDEPAVLTTTRPGRITKGNAQTIIRNAIVPKSKAPRIPATNRAAPRRNLRQTVDSASGGDTVEIDIPLDDRGTFMEDIRTMVQGSISEAFATRDGREGDGNLATNLPPALVAGGPQAGAGTVSHSIPSLLTLPSPPSIPPLSSLPSTSPLVISQPCSRSLALGFGRYGQEHRNR